MSFDIRKVNGRTILHLDSSRIEACMRHFREANIDNLTVNYIRGYELRDLTFLRDHPYVNNLTLVLPGDTFDTGALSHLRGLKRLICNVTLRIEPADHPLLEELRGEWRPDVDYAGFSRLSTLALWHFAPRCRDCRPLSELQGLRSLALVQAKIDSLAGLEALSGLRALELAHLRTATNFHPVGSLKHLEKLELDSCRNLEDYGFLAELALLRWLVISKCADLPSLAFLDQLPSLEHFAFFNTTVVDGDLTRLLRLTSAAFNGKKHYSHTPAQIEKLLGQRH